MRTLNTIPNRISFFLLFSTVFCCISAFQQQQQQQQGYQYYTVGTGLSSSSSSSPITHQSLPSLSLSSSSRYFASVDVDNDNGDNISLARRARTMTMTTNLRNRLRKVTGFSFTLFRATLRGITGISFTALYASSVAVTGLWIRKSMSILLGFFPSGFRYFLQPFLVLYYTPLILLRTVTGPTRKRAVAKHETVVDVWKEAVLVAEKVVEKDGYSPVSVSEDGYFELQAPPSTTSTVLSIDNHPSDDDDCNNDSSENTATTAATTTNEDMANAMAATVEYAMEIKNKNANDGGKIIK